MPLILGTNSVKGGYNVANSLRFNSGSSDYLNITPSSASNRKTFTISFWTKICKFDTTGYTIIGAGNSSSGEDGELVLKIDNFGRDGQLILQTGPTVIFETTQALRDTAAWYHIVVSVDTTNGTSGNRVRLYINGSEVSDFDVENQPSENQDFAMNSNVVHEIGRFPRITDQEFDGYLAEFVLIDGQQLDPTSFGEFDEDTGIWKPKAVSGLTFGTNGFYLEFKQSGTSQNSSGLGADTSGQDNHFAVNNLTAIDQSTDTCTNNYITMNPNNATLGGVTLSEGNLKASLNGNYQVFGTINLTSGKWYWEQKIEGSSLFVSVADGNRATVNTGTGLLNRDYAWAYRSDGVRQHENTTSSYGDSFTTNDIIGVALDMDNGFIYFSKNGTFQNSGDPTSGATGTGAAYSSLHTDAAAPDGLTPCLGQYGGDQITSWNFGSPSYSISSGNADANGYGNFEHAVPSGYYAINTKNLAEYG